MKCQALKLSFLMLSLILLLSSSTLGSPHRRTIYTASLQAHVEHLHTQLLSMGLYPVPLEKLERHHGLNSMTAKVRVPTSSMKIYLNVRTLRQSMATALQQDASHAKLKISELEQSVS